MTDEKIIIENLRKWCFEIARNEMTWDDLEELIENASKIEKYIVNGFKL